jgi:folylpolyglutamate synthase/dihydropteroate synthase
MEMLILIKKGVFTQQQLFMVISVLKIKDVKIILNALTQFSINEHVYYSKIPPIAYKKLLLNLFKNISYFAVQIMVHLT